MANTDTIYIGLDDTDTKESRGTGRLAREIAADLTRDFPVHGVVRHQLLKDPRVPYTSHNSSATIIIDGMGTAGIPELFARVKDMMRADFQDGSDPGLCVTRDVPRAIVEFGLRAKRELVHQDEARGLARAHAMALEGLGGTEDGVIGALSSVGLTSAGDDGRYLLVGTVRDLSGMVPVEAVLGAGVSEVRTVNGEVITGGTMHADKIRPARRGGAPVAYVERHDGYWEPLKLD